MALSRINGRAPGAETGGEVSCVLGLFGATNVSICAEDWADTLTDQVEIFGVLVPGWRLFAHTPARHANDVLKRGRV